MIFFGTDNHLKLLIMLNIDLYIFFYFLVCIFWAIFKEYIGGLSQESKKVKKRLINSKLENLPMVAISFITDTHLIHLSVI